MECRRSLFDVYPGIGEIEYRAYAGQTAYNRVRWNLKLPLTEHTASVRLGIFPPADVESAARSGPRSEASPNAPRKHG
jgi:hypothetical protein